MADKLRPLIAGNWKMNGTRASLAELEGVIAGAGKAAQVDLLICPPATLVAAAVTKAAGTPVGIGGQDCHASASGAHTGDVSAEMLKDAGAVAVIVGHSERRTDHGETDAAVRSKAEAAWRAGLVAIVCVGETQGERDAGKATEVVGRQLAGSVPIGGTDSNLVVAYEPVWAIGTGRTPTNPEIEEIHQFIRSYLIQNMKQFGPQIKILYGGSVKPSNAAEILKLANVNGALVGGASLKAVDFLAIAAGAS
ncbi:MAG: triose-phosphate isomerase [Proteobacteria bacterium SG_bin9]|nr:MAG: triose-phosphate isomerase [Proteobacteria bacterium SG_bin9]